MTPYTVEWVLKAEDELGRIWLRQVAARKAITTAQAQIDQLLAQDPLSNGQHRSEGLYRIDLTPLICTYTVDAKRRHVKVTWVWYVP
jgi:hypothetical protein